MKVIISTHLDDATLSLGGSILKWRSKKDQVKIINVFTISNWQKEGFQKHMTTAIRKKEEIKVCKILGITPIFLGIPDTTLRGYSKINFWVGKLDWKIDKKYIRKVEDRLLKYLKKGQEIYFPLAIGDHVDHKLINKIGEKLFKSKKFKIYFYEDLPYATRHPFKKNFVRRLKLKPKLIDIAGFLDKKIELLKIYDSQLYFNQDIAPVRKYALKFKPGKPCERIWK